MDGSDLGRGEEVDRLTTPRVRRRGGRLSETTCHIARAASILAAQTVNLAHALLRRRVSWESAKDKGIARLREKEQQGDGTGWGACRSPCPHTVSTSTSTLSLGICFEGNCQVGDGYVVHLHGPCFSLGSRLAVDQRRPLKKKHRRPTCGCRPHVTD